MCLRIGRIVMESNEILVKPTISKEIYHLKGESLILFDYSQRQGKSYRIFYGIGIVYRVVKGDKQDLVYINFGIFKERKTRLVVIYENHARRQLITLKRGQVCQVYGVCRHYTTKINLNGVETKGMRLGLYATAIQGWYVPTMFDIRKMPTNEDIVSPSEKEQDLINTFEDVLDDFLNGTGEDEDEIERD